MKPVVVFLGPTLAHDEARAVLDAEYLPPAGHGDILRAALRRPKAIALVDGVFERAPAVWHKEILFALSEGVHVYGAASMGALRAAELDRFGMRGVGDVYRAYAEGALEDDDEVAVAHADAERGFAAVSDSMVDVRATLAAAVADGVVGESAAAEIVDQVKSTFYADRVLLGALRRGDEEHERLRAWLPEGRVSRKREDALALLRVVAEELGADPQPFEPTWTLQRTRYWEEVRRSVESAPETETPPASAPGAAADEELAAVLDEARLDPDGYAVLLDRALLAALARRAAGAVDADVSAWAQRTALDEERRRLGMLDPTEVDAWLEQRDLGRRDLPAVAQRLAALRWAHAAHRDSVAGEIALTVRSGDEYPRLAARAKRKRRVLARLPAAAALDVRDEEVVSWYFRERLGRDVPVALDAWASAHGWPRVGDLVRALRAEWQLEQAVGGLDDPAG